ncbi:hypothetical protein Tco_1367393 [Tanacetum coccineum]
MAELISKKFMKKSQADSNPTEPNTDDDIYIKLSKEFLMELKNNAYHGMFDEDVVDNIAKVLELLDLIQVPDPDLYLQYKMSGEEPAPQMAPVESPQMISTVKLLMLKKGKYTLWSMRMEQYLTNTDYDLWQVIMNGDEPVQTTKDENGVETEVPPKTAQAVLARQKERKAKSILQS